MAGDVGEARRPRAVVLVEGTSDAGAVRALAARRGRDLAAERVEVVVMSGVTNASRFVAAYGPAGAGVRLAGLYDAAEERFVRGALERAGFGAPPQRDRLSALGFFCCDADLEDELVRALGVRTVEEVLRAAGDLGAFRTLQQQPAQRGRPVEAQLRRFFGAGSGRKNRYATLLVDALDLARVPGPLDAVLAHVS